MGNDMLKAIEELNLNILTLNNTMNEMLAELKSIESNTRLEVTP